MITQVIATSKAIAQAEDPTSFLDFKTVLLIAVTVVLLLVAKKLLGMHRRLEALETAAPFPKPDSAAIESNVIPAHTVAAISAAIHTTLNARHKILSIGEAHANRQAWSVEGRRQVFQSHKVR
jgi:hypothetical protein